MRPLLRNRQSPGGKNKLSNQQGIIIGEIVNAGDSLGGNHQEVHLSPGIDICKNGYILILISDVSRNFVVNDFGKKSLFCHDCESSKNCQLNYSIFCPDCDFMESPRISESGNRMRLVRPESGESGSGFSLPKTASRGVK